MRPIDGDALWQKMCELDEMPGATEPYDQDSLHRDTILFAIEQAETLKVYPIVHAEWIRFGSLDADVIPYKCSHCGDEIMVDWREESIFDYKYCRGCGSRMDKRPEYMPQVLGERVVVNAADMSKSQDMAKACVDDGFVMSEGLDDIRKRVGVYDSRESY